MKPTLPKGTRDFAPEQVLKRDHIFSIIRKTFAAYGYAPIETPAMESLSTLTGKYGEEGDKLLFKVLNNGDFLAKADAQALDDRNSDKVISSIAKRGLRYDLTVPFARFVSMHRNDLQFPFKRYQVQPVWRADRPQKGRYQEFYQCDADVVGSDSLIYECEFIQIFDTVFSELNLKVKIRYNHRQILLGVAQYAGVEDKFVEMTTSLDKLDKIGEQGVLQELDYRGISNESGVKILELIQESDAAVFEEKVSSTEAGKQGFDEVNLVKSYLSATELSNDLVLDPTLARGLSYYTGTIFEVESLETEMGSIAAGGRYADLTSLFGMPDMSGVGISFGAERIYDIMETLERFPAEISNTLQVLILPMDVESMPTSLMLSRQMRDQHISVDVYPGPAKMKKMMKYANGRSVPYVVIIGEDERNSNRYMLKQMQNGEQGAVSIEELLTIVK
jgi:histidyl-tRNA synthetase